MKRKKVGQIDLGTGEQLDGVIVYIAKKRRNGFTEGWMAMSQLAGDFLAERRKELGEEGLAVFLALVGHLDFENRLVLNQAELGRKFGILRQNVQRSIKRLMGMGVLLEGPKSGQNRTYQLNPALCWKGSAKNHHEALSEQRKKKMKAGKAKEKEAKTAPEEKP
jgi:hypothetical protein